VKSIIEDRVFFNVFLGGLCMHIKWEGGSYILLGRGIVSVTFRFWCRVLKKHTIDNEQQTVH